MIFSWLKKNLAPWRMYIRLSPERVYIRNLKTGAIFDEPAKVAITGLALRNPKIIAIGNDAELAANEPDTGLFSPLASPFTHDGYIEAEALLKRAVAKCNNNASFILPSIVLQWIGAEDAPPLSAEDQSALQELAALCGASKVYFAESSAALTDEEVMMFH